MWFSRNIANTCLEQLGNDLRRSFSIVNQWTGACLRWLMNFLFYCCATDLWNSIINRKSFVFRESTRSAESRSQVQICWFTSRADLLNPEDADLTSPNMLDRQKKSDWWFNKKSLLMFKVQWGSANWSTIMRLSAQIWKRFREIKKEEIERFHMKAAEKQRQDCLWRNWKYKDQRQGLSWKFTRCSTW